MYFRANTGMKKLFNVLHFSTFWWRARFQPLAKKKKKVVNVNCSDYLASENNPAARQATVDFHLTQIQYPTS